MLQIWLPLNGHLNNQGLNSTNGTWVGSSSYDNNGKIGKCVSCNSSHYVVCPYNFQSTNKFSQTFWIYIPSTLGNCGQSETVYRINGYLISWTSYNNLKIYNNGNNQLWWLSSDIFYDKWVHLAIVHTGNTIQLYINGLLYGEATSSYTAISSGTIQLGNGIDTTYGPVKFCDYRLYDSALSPKEVHEIAKGLVLHYPMNDEYAESTINLGNNGSVRGWNNSGNSIRNGNDTSIPKILDSQPVYSIKVTTAGNCAITFSSVNASSFKGQTVTASCWFYTNSSVSASTPYLRSSINNNVITQLKYNGTTNPTTWPKNQWIRLTGTGTVDPNETSVYFCDYANNLNEFRAYTCWQLELKDHVTPYTPTTRNELVYDCSGYCNNGTVTGSLQVVDDSPRYNNSIKNISTVDNIIKAELNMSSMNQLTLNWWGKYNDGFRNGVSKGTTLLGGYINSSNDPNCANDYDTTAFNYRDGIWDMYNGFSHYRLNDSLNGITDNTWRMYTLVWNGSKAIQYVNGDQINSIAVSGTLVPFKYLYIGQSYAGGVNRVTTGCWSDIRLYSTALSDDDIKELYNTSAIINNNNTLEAYEFVE